MENTGEEKIGGKRLGGKDRWEKTEGKRPSTVSRCKACVWKITLFRFISEWSLFCLLLKYSTSCFWKFEHHFFLLESNSRQKNQTLSETAEISSVFICKRWNCLLYIPYRTQKYDIFHVELHIKNYMCILAPATK